jgi:hypothetical protein
MVLGMNGIGSLTEEGQKALSMNKQIGPPKHQICLCFDLRLLRTMKNKFLLLLSFLVYSVLLQ